VGYAINYPLGVFGIIAVIIISKTIMKIKPDDEMKKFRLAKINLEVQDKSIASNLELNKAFE
jgi:putative transport protein